MPFIARSLALSAFERQLFDFIAQHRRAFVILGRDGVDQFVAQSNERRPVIDDNSASARRFADVFARAVNAQQERVEPVLERSILVRAAQTPGFAELLKAETATGARLKIGFHQVFG